VIKELEEFAQLRDSYWKLLNKHPYQLSEVVVYWHFIYKQIQRNFTKIPEDMMSNLKNILGKFVEWIDSHGYLLRMSPLWKHGHPSNLYDNQLFLLDSKFKEISKNIQVHSLLQTDVKNQWSAYVDEDFKRTLIDGLCTVRYLVTVTHKSEQFQRLFDHIKEIPNVTKLYSNLF
jgi:predicted small metal-binding protein